MVLGLIMILDFALYYDHFVNNNNRSYSIEAHAASQISNSHPGQQFINIKDIIVKGITNKTANIKTTFNIHNPTTNTLLLDGIHYNIYVNKNRLTSGDIGTEAAVDIVRSQPAFPVIGNSNLTLQDSKIILKNGLSDVLWNNVVKNDTNFIVNGTYFVRQSSYFQSLGPANDFNVIFHR